MLSFSWFCSVCRQRSSSWVQASRLLSATAISLLATESAIWAQEPRPRALDQVKPGSATQGPFESRTRELADRERAEARRVIEEAEALLESSMPDQQLGNAQNRLRDSDFIRRAQELASPSQRADAISRLSRVRATEGSFGKSRETSLKISEENIAVRVQSLLTLAKAESVNRNTRQAWWTLYEAKKHAMRIQDTQVFIGVFREIDRIERDLRSGIQLESSATTKTPLGRSDVEPPPLRGDLPTPQIIKKALDDGLPPDRYQEIAVLSQGGGPFREPPILQHMYYYNGDRFFQGPLLNPGPTVVRVTHPFSGEQCCCRVNMPYGAPVIEYENDSIEYHFEDVIIFIDFKKSGLVKTGLKKHGTKYRRYRAKLSASLASDPDSPEINNGFTDTVGNLLNIGLGAPIGVAKKLPVLSGLLEKKDKRIPSTLSQPE